MTDVTATPRLDGIPPRLEKIMVSGWRHWSDQEAVFTALDYVYTMMGRPWLVLMHGAATGADACAARWADSHQRVLPDEFPADWKRFGPKAGPIRNRQMIAKNPRYLIAFPHPESIGTVDAINTASVHNIQVLRMTWDEREQMTERLKERLRVRLEIMGEAEVTQS